MDKEFCPKGHPNIPENRRVRTRKNGSKFSECLLCHRIRERNRERGKTRDQKKAHYLKYKEVMDESSRRWKKNNPEKCRVRNREYKRKRRLGKDEEAYEYSKILRGDPCSYCGAKSESIDHIVPVALGGRNTADNLTSACKSCNSSKNDTALLVWLAQRH